MKRRNFRLIRNYINFMLNCIKFIDLYVILSVTVLRCQFKRLIICGLLDLIKIHYLNQFNQFISQFHKFLTFVRLSIIYFVLQCRKMSSPFKLFVIALWSVTMATAKTLDDDECPDFSGMDNFSLYAFLGKWYEVERYPTARFENHTCIQIDYQQTSQNSTGGYIVVFFILPEPNFEHAFESSEFCD